VSEHIKKSHNKTLLLYHLVCPAKYRRKVFTKEVEQSLKEVCCEISKCYEIHFVEIGADMDHVHFLLQSIPMFSPTKIVRTVKSITAREIFRLHPEVKKMLWGGQFWTDGYYMNTVGHYANEKVIAEYVKNQGSQSYKQIHRGQLTIFDGLP
jgi:putative transposase